MKLEKETKGYYLMLMTVLFQYAEKSQLPSNAKKSSGKSIGVYLIATCNVMWCALYSETYALTAI